MHAGCCQRMANGDQAPVPWRLSHSVILLAGPAAASSRRTPTRCDRDLYHPCGSPRTDQPFLGVIGPAILMDLRRAANASTVGS